MPATAIGSVAIVLWGFLAVFTVLTEPIPPFQLMAMTFAIASTLAAAKWGIRRENPLRYLRQPWPVWALGVAGLFGYHFLYFMALRHAPPIEASLIAYLWPLLIVLFSALLVPAADRQPLKAGHYLGALLGFGGAILLVTRGQSFSLDPQYSRGYALALACALTWASYSVLSRRFRQVPTDTVAGFCFITAILATLIHLGLETTHTSLTPRQGFGVIALGLGPVGLAFYVWDIGVKRGNLRLLGVLSYFAPLISTLALIGFGLAAYSHTALAACGLIVLGSLLAARAG